MKNNTISILILIFVLSTSIVKSQINLSISGIIIDSISQQPIKYCSILFKNITDTTKKTIGAITDENGSFKIDLPIGSNYLMQFSMIGYKMLSDTAELEIEEGSSDDLKNIPTEQLKLNMGKIKLVPDADLLKTVTVKESSNILKIDNQTVIITDKLRANTIAAKDMFNKIDAISYNKLTQEIKVDNDKKVKLLVNGVGKDADYILNLNPKRIKKIEILRNISGMYAIESYTSIINVITYANYRGIDFMLSDQYLNNFVSPNKPLLTSNSSIVNIDITRDKFNFYLKTSGIYFKTSLFSRTLTEYTQSNDKIINGRGDEPNIINNYTNYNALLGADYRVNKKHFIGFETSIKGFPAINNTKNLSYDTLIMNNDSTIINNVTNSYSKYHNFFGNLFYRFKIDSASKLTTYLNYTFTKTQSQQTINNEQNLNYNKTSSNLKYNVEYERNFHKKYTLTTGVAYLNNNYLSTIEKNQQDNFSNYFDKSRGYAYLKIHFNETTGLLFGSTFEHYYSRNDQTEMSFNTFRPRLNIDKKLNKKTKLTLEYRLNTQYPYLSDLNPQITYTTPYIINIGNPELKPYLFHDFSLEYRRVSDGFLNYLSVKSYYNYSDNSLGYRPMISDSIIVYKNENYVKHEKYGIETNLSFKIKEKLAIDIYIDAFKDWNKNLETPNIIDWIGGSELTYTVSAKHYLGLMYEKNLAQNVTSLGYNKSGDNYLFLYWMTMQLKGRLQLIIGYSLPLIQSRLNIDYESTNGYNKTTFTDVSFMKNLLFFNLTYRISKGKVNKEKKNIVREQYDKSNESKYKIKL